MSASPSPSSLTPPSPNETSPSAPGSASPGLGAPSTATGGPADTGSPSGEHGRVPHPDLQWLDGNAVELLENGEGYYPAVFDAIRKARHEVRLETFILFDDPVGRELRQVLLDAAQRGVQVHALVDGWGSPDLGDEFLGPLVQAGVDFRVFDPVKRLFGYRLNLFRRMHRKIVVVDGEVGFIGGINFSEDHLLKSGPEAKQDYAVRLRGPVVRQLRDLTRANLRRPAVAERWRRWLHRRRKALPSGLGSVAGTASARVIARDNHRHLRLIEQSYRAAIRQARHRIWIANAYFFPGHGLLRDLRRAARRGVDVRLILQGEPDMAIVRTAAQLLHGHLQRAGVRIFEYCERPLHGKVAVIDDDWATVGSSNLDPTSLALNLEANVELRDRTFNAELARNLAGLMDQACHEVAPQPLTRWQSAWAQVRGSLVGFAVRHFPGMLLGVPASAPTISRLTPAADGSPQAPRQTAPGVQTGPSSQGPEPLTQARA